MARFAFEPFATVAPQGAPANDEMRIQATPDMFGGAIARGEQQFGQGLENASAAGFQTLDYYSKIAAQDAYNKFDNAATNIAYGDGTSGNPGFYGLKGEAAMRAYPDARQRLNDTQQQILGGLSGPARLEFQQNSRYLMARELRMMGAHYDQQLDTYAENTLNATVDTAVRRVGLQWNDDQTFNDALSGAIKTVDQIREQRGWSHEQADDYLAKIRTKLAISRVEGMAATDPDGAEKMLEKYRPNIDANAYLQMHDHLLAKADEEAGHKAAVDAPGTSRGGQIGTQPAGDAAGMLRGFEGFRTQPYWDVNHWRVGYGSDTVTRADGTIETVTPFTRVTREDAERDLARRIGDLSSRAKVAFGVDENGNSQWDKLPPSAKAAVISVGYNYGHIPRDLIGPGQRGDAQALAQAIAALPANPGRRAQEAQAVLGRFVPTQSGFAGGPGAQMVMPAAASGAPQPASASPEPIPTVPAPAAPGAPQVAPAVATADQQPKPPETASTTQPARPSDAAFVPAPIGNATPEDIRANKIRAIEERADLNDRAKRIAISDVNQAYTAAQIAAEQDAKAVHARHEAAMEKYYDMANRGQFAQAFQELNQDQTIGERERDELSQMLTRRSGENNPRDYGSGFTEIRRRMLLPYGDPNLIHSKRQILEAENDGLITPKGGDELMRNMDGLNKEDEGGIVARQNGIMQQVRQAFVHDLDIGPVKVADQKGLEHYNDFLNIFLPQFDKWRAAGNDPWKYPLFEQGSIKEVMEQIYPKKQRDMDRMNMGAEAAGQQAASGETPSAPHGVSADAWNVVMAQRPAGGRGQVPLEDWARMVGQLAADPKRMAPIWDQSQFGRAGFKAADVLDQLGIELTPGKPENVGAGPTIPVKEGRERRSSAPAEPLPSVPGPL